MRILRLVPDLPRLRISSIDSIEADENLMQAIATEAAPDAASAPVLQAGDDMILKRMKRRHLRDDAIRFCEEAARACAPTSSSAPTSSPASRPRPTRCSKTR
jgi:threonylcarbamoyladenosine tRNA methylthiotransferase MtaB